MANEVEIINNPTSTPDAVSTGYQAQNTNIVSARLGMDGMYVRSNGSSITINISGVIDVNGVLYSIPGPASVTLTPGLGVGQYWIDLVGSGNYLTPTLSTTAPSFNSSKKAHYNSSGERVLNTAFYFDGTTCHLNYYDKPISNIFKLTSSGSWTAPFTKYYELIMTGSGGDGAIFVSDAVNRIDAHGGGGGAGGTGIARFFTLAGAGWSYSQSLVSGANCTFSYAGTTFSIQNGFDAVTPVITAGAVTTFPDAGYGGGTGSGFDILLNGGDGHNGLIRTQAVGGTTLYSGTGNGAASYWGGGGRSSLSGNAQNGKSYGSGGGGCNNIVYNTPGTGKVGICVIRG